MLALICALALGPQRPGGTARERSATQNLLEGTRYVELPLSSDKVAAIRFIIVGLVLILLMAFRPQGILGSKQEMLLGE